MFKQPEREAGRLEVIFYKLSEKAAEALSNDYDVSLAYVTCALKKHRLEMARDFNRTVKSETLAKDALDSAKRKFPVLEDLQKALESGVVVAKRTYNERMARIARNARSSLINQQNQAQIEPPTPVVKHPRQVKRSSTLNRIPVISDGEKCTDEDGNVSDAFTEAFPDQTKAEIEVVPSNPIAANGLDDTDVKLLRKHVTFVDIDLNSDMEDENKPGWSSDEWEDDVEEEAFCIDSVLT